MKAAVNTTMFTLGHEYPASPDEVLDPPMRFKRGVLKAAQKLKASKPWAGSLTERAEKFRVFINDICEVYGVKPPVLDTTGFDPHEPSDHSYYMPLMRKIVLVGRPSCVTMFHELGHHLGKNEFDACRWSLSLFRRVFPRQWARLRFEGHMARLRHQSGT